MNWKLVRDLNGHRQLESVVGKLTIVIVLEPNLNQPVSWLLEQMEEKLPAESEKFGKPDNQQTDAEFQRNSADWMKDAEAEGKVKP